MNLWIVTIGSSDVQFESDEVSKHKGRPAKENSEKIWNRWYNIDLKEEHYDLRFLPKQAFSVSEEPYRISPRILGEVYKNSSEKVQQQIWSYLTFPLLDDFERALKQYPLPEAIAVVLTDQSAIFQEDQQRNHPRNYPRSHPKCPYWQDTCELKPILKRYFRERFEIIPKWIELKPTTEEQGLDSWNGVLDLVRKEFFELVQKEVRVAPEERIYVSHQASTPAISSAVQFMSLAIFRDSVQFLVSNENTNKVYPISQSTYLRAIRLQEAKALLKRHDYSGVRDILGLTDKKPDLPEEKRIKDLLDAGELWNFAEFQKFKKILTSRKLLPIDSFPWYQSGYESIYLAWTRLKQGSTVDAMFHSFRAIEGSASLWAERSYKQGNYVWRDPKKGLQLSYSIQNIHSGMKSWFGDPQKPKNQIGLFGKPLFALLREVRTTWKTDRHIGIFCKPIDKNYSGKDIFSERNKLFHRLEGLHEADLFDAWGTKDKDPDEWIESVLGCLNFIAEKDVKFLEEISLMAKLHKELLDTISL